MEKKYIPDEFETYCRISNCKVYITVIEKTQNRYNEKTWYVIKEEFDDDFGCVYYRTVSEELMRVYFEYGR